MKKILIPLVLIFVIAVIGAVYFASNLAKTKESGNNSSKQDTKPKISTADSEAFNNLINKGNRSCVLKNEEEVGTIKIFEKSMFAKTKNNLTGKIYNTLIIEDTMYTWEQGKNNGAKIKRDPSKPKIQEEFVNTLRPYLNTETLECEPANIDATELEIPRNIRFIDINALM